MARRRWPGTQSWHICVAEPSTTPLLSLVTPEQPRATDYKFEQWSYCQDIQDATRCLNSVIFLGQQSPVGRHRRSSACPPKGLLLVGRLNPKLASGGMQPSVCRRPRWPFHNREYGVWSALLFQSDDASQRYDLRYRGIERDKALMSGGCRRLSGTGGAVETTLWIPLAAY